MSGTRDQGAIHLVGLTLGYERHPAVHHLDGTICAGAMLALVGPNGAGKSTLLKGLVGEIPCLDGRIAWETGRRGIGYLPQADEIDRGFPLSVLDLAGMGLWRRSGAWRSLGRRVDDVAAALAAVGLSGFETRPIGTLSGGQFQRALFARLILQDARVILLDEPFTGVDAHTMTDLIGLIGRWHGEGRTIVAALHDLAQVRAHFPETLLLAREPVAWGPTEQVLNADNLARATRLSEAWDETAAVCRKDHDGHGHGDGPGSHHHGPTEHDHGHRHGPVARHHGDHAHTHESAA